MHHLALVLSATLALGWSAPRAARVLDIYWIDVEGGASTLIVTAQGQSLLVDTGYAGLDERDPARIEHVVRREAGLTRLDYVLTSHFHADHVGGLASVAKRIPVGTFLDHGESVEMRTPAGRSLYDEYVATVGDRRRIVKPGDRVPLAGANFTIVASHGQAITTPLGRGAPNAYCADFKAQAADAGENGMSLGYLLNVGDFDFLDLGDVSWNFQAKLVCPNNLLGVVDLAQAPHHAVRDDVLPQMMWAVAPTVAVVNNGPVKGAGAAGMDYVLKSPGLQDVWSLHRALSNDAAHNAPEAHTANLGPTADCEGAWLRARVDDAGTFTLTNGRTGLSKPYKVR